MKLKLFKNIFLGLIIYFLILLGVLYYLGYRDLSGYLCPKEKHIDCFPIIDPSESRYPYCVGEYHKWLEKNCDMEWGA